MRYTTTSQDAAGYLGRALKVQTAKFKIRTYKSETRNPKQRRKIRKKGDSKSVSRIFSIFRASICRIDAAALIVSRCFTFFSPSFGFVSDFEL
jgi:hypothetical protein